MKRYTRWAAAALVLGTGLAVMNYYAPLQWWPVVFDLALIVMLAGAVSMLFPLRFLGIRSRGRGAAVLLAGVLAAGAALNWPAGTKAARGRSKLDEFMPAWSSREFHSERIHASPDRVYRALRETTFADIKVFVTLMQLRNAASGHFRRVRAAEVPVLDAMSRPGSGFLPLADDGHGEMVFGLVGRFWGSGPPQIIHTPEDFRAFEKPGMAKSAFNLRVEDLGDGWSRVSTETRAIGVDEAGTRAMMRYWRVIYPGSACIRRMWLTAIKERAER